MIAPVRRLAVRVDHRVAVVDQLLDLVAQLHLVVFDAEADQRLDLAVALAPILVDEFLAGIDDRVDAALLGDLQALEDLLVRCCRP